MNDSNAAIGYWFESEKKHELVFGITKFMRRTQAVRRALNHRHLSLYNNNNTLGISPHNYALPASVGISDRLSYNLIQSVVDTKTNKIGKSQPKATFLTSDGVYKLKRKAKKLSRFSLGQMYATKMYEKAPEIYKHAAIFGTGAAKVYRVGADIRVDLTFIDELMVDDADAYHGEPMNLYQEKSIPREVLARKYPKFAEAIRSAPKSEGNHQETPSMSDMVTTVEAWHLATIDDEGQPHGGCHAICIEGADLVDEEYKRDYFPFLFYRQNKPVRGFFGDGTAYRLSTIQAEITSLLRTIQDSFRLCGIPQYWFKTGARNVKSRMNNEVGTLNEAAETPTLMTPAPINPLFIQHFQNLIQRGMEQEGVSELSAQSQKPSGLDSGKSLREFNDIESDRFNLEGKAYEQMFMEATRQFLDLGKEIAEEYPDYTVKVHDRKFMESIPWSEVDMKEDEYALQMFPTSLLSTTPSGRLNDVKDLMQIGDIPPEQGLDLLDFPDLDRYVSLKNAALDDIERTIEQLVDGNYQAPEPFQNLTLGLQMMQSAYLKYKADGLEEENLELMRRWMEEAKNVVAPPAPPPPAGASQGIPQGQAQAVPQAAPVSDMLPTMGPGAQ